MQLAWWSLVEGVLAIGTQGSGTDSRQSGWQTARQSRHFSAILPNFILRGKNSITTPTNNAEKLNNIESSCITGMYTVLSYSYITVLPLFTRLAHLTLVYCLGAEGMSSPVDLGGRVVAAEESLLAVWGLGRSGVRLPNSLYSR